MSDLMHPSLEPLTQEQRVLVASLVMQDLSGLPEWEKAIENMDKDTVHRLLSERVEPAIELLEKVGWPEDES